MSVNNDGKLLHWSILSELRKEIFHHLLLVET